VTNKRSQAGILDFVVHRSNMTGWFFGVFAKCHVGISEDEVSAMEGVWRQLMSANETGLGDLSFLQMFSASLLVLGYFEWMLPCILCLSFCCTSNYLLGSFFEISESLEPLGAHLVASLDNSLEITLNLASSLNGPSDKARLAMCCVM
jgi:hypothetical protein